MGYFGRLFYVMIGRSKSRIPCQLSILGASPELIAEARGKKDDEQEKVLLHFVEGKHAIMIDWRDKCDQIYESLQEILSAEEKSFLPPKKEIPQEALSAIFYIKQALSHSKRTLVHTESFGDFSFLFLIPRENESAFIQCVGPWLIKDKKFTK